MRKGSGKIPTCGHPDRPHEAHGLCKPCYQGAYRKVNRTKALEVAKQYRKDNPEQFKGYQKRRYHDNPEEERERIGKWRDDNRDRLRQYDREKRKSHPELKRISEAKRRAALKLATDPTANTDTIAVFYKQATRLSQQLGILFEVDHILAIKNGGKHHQNNLQVIPEAINAKKNAKILKHPIWADPGFSLLAECIL